MSKIARSIENLFTKSFWVVGIASLLLTVNLLLPTQPVYAATQVKPGSEEVIQPFELTKPAATREEAYDEVAELNKDPKKLIAAENKEENAEEKVYEAEQKAAKSIWNK
jgi:hypothetical protein